MSFSFIIYPGIQSSLQINWEEMLFKIGYRGTISYLNLLSYDLLTLVFYVLSETDTTS